MTLWTQSADWVLSHLTQHKDERAAVRGGEGHSLKRLQLGIHKEKQFLFA